MKPFIDKQRVAPPGGTDRRAGECGFILVAVLWILGGLSVLAAVYALYVVNTATALSVDSDRLQANASVSSALELTSYYLGALKSQERPSSGQFTFQVGRSTVVINFVSEAARVDLNSAPKQLLAGLFRVLGAAADDADYYADRIIGWRTPAVVVSQNLDLNSGTDAETTIYRNAGAVYNPRGAPFVNVDELWLVLGLPSAIVARTLPFVTVYSGKPNINVMDAAPEVLAALPGMTPDRLVAVLRQREATPTDARPVIQLVGNAGGIATASASDSIRIFARVNLPDGRRVKAEAVVLLLQDAPDPYRVLSWTDDFDG